LSISTIGEEGDTAGPSAAETRNLVYPTIVSNQFHSDPVGQIL
jgi:hypothetical protein